MTINYTCGRKEKVSNLQQAYYKTGEQKLLTNKHSRKRLLQIKSREARHIGYTIEY